MNCAVLCRSAERGFSLVEMAIATLLIAIFLTLGLGALNVQQENAGATTTQRNQDTIKDALVNYLRTNKHLPCPSDFQDLEPSSTKLAGEERRTTTSVAGVPDKTTDCDARLVGTGPYLSSFGILPYRALGMTRDAALDGWGNYFSYHVSFIATATSPNSNDWTRSRAFLSTGNTGVLTIKESATSANSLTTTAVVVVLSHGRNGLGAYTTKGTRFVLPDQMVGTLSVTADEYENATNTTSDVTYVRRTRTDNESATGGSFDDYVVYLSDNDLLTQLVKDSSIKWGDLTVSDDFDRIKNAITGYIVTHSTDKFDSDCRGTPTDGVQAERWLLQAAQHGIVGAQSVIGLMYVSGVGVPRNPEKAVQWLTLAANAGDAEASMLLKRMGVDLVAGGCALAGGACSGIHAVLTSAMSLNTNRIPS